MTALDKLLIENKMLADEAHELKRQGFIGEEQFRTIKKQLKLPNSNDKILLRLMFFLLGTFLYSSASGVVGLAVTFMLTGNYSLILIVLGIIGVVVAELMAKAKYYVHGLDDAFILTSQFYFLAAVAFLSESVILMFLVMGILGIAFCIRYVNSVSALFSAVGFGGVLATAVIQHKILPTAVLPFIMFFYAAFLYIFYRYFISVKTLVLYHTKMNLVHIISLLLLYFSVNYMVVRELSVILLKVKILSGDDIAFAWLFYALTFIIPVAFIYFALKRKIRVMLYIGLITLVFSVYTIRYYHAIMPVEYALMIGGGLLFVVAYLTMTLLRHVRSGVSFLPEHAEVNESIDLAQAAVVTSATDFGKTITDQSPMNFGGGGYSGGGAGESY